MALHDTVRNLSAVPTFAVFEPEALRLIAFSAEMRILRTGDALFRRGDASDGGYVLLSGTIVLESEAGPPVVVKAPVLIGDTALITETIRPADAVAREPSSVLKISRDMFRRVMSEYPDSAIRLREALASRLSSFQRELDGLRFEAGE